MNIQTIQKNKLPNGWGVKKLGEICKIVSGSTPKTNVKEYWDGNILWLTPKDLSKFKGLEIFDTERKITKTGYESCSTTLVPKGTVLMSSRAPIGYLAIAGKELCTNQGFKSFICSDKINNKYLYYFLKNIVDKLKQSGSGTTFEEISKSKSKNIEIVLPPLSVQHQIVSKLDAFFVHYNKLKEEKQKAKKMHEKILQGMIASLILRGEELPEGWGMIKLGNKDLTYKITQGPNPKYRKETDDNFRVLKTKDIYNNIIFYEKSDRIDKELFQEFSKFELKDGDFLISLVGVGSIGKVNIFREQENKKFIFTRATGLIRTNKDKLLPEYLHIFFLSNIGQKLIEKGIAGTTGQLVIRTSYLKELEIPIPTLDIQRSIVKKINLIFGNMKLLENERKKIDFQLDQLPKSLLAKAFRGELN